MRPESAAGFTQGRTPLDYERSWWLYDRCGLPLAGDPETAAAYENAYACLHQATLSFLWQAGPWWGKTGRDLRAEVQHWNRWKAWEAYRQRMDERAAQEDPVTYAHLLAVSFRRLKALLAVGDVDRFEYPVFLHLHERIREAARHTTELERFERQSAAQRAQPRSPLQTQPVWELVHEPLTTYHPASHLRTVNYTQAGNIRYGFVFTDLTQPMPPSGVPATTLCLFSHRTQATTIYLEHLYQLYAVESLLDLQEGGTILEPWHPPRDERI